MIIAERRTAIEAAIGHMKTDGRMNRCRLKGELGDALNAVLVAAGRNIRLLLRRWWLFYVNCSADCWRSSVPASPATQLRHVGLRSASPFYQ